MKKFFVLSICILLIFSLTGCGLTEKLEEHNEQVREKYSEQGRINVEGYLKDKYPENTYEITSITVRKSGSHGILEDAIPSGYSSIVYVKVEDKKGNLYNVKTDASKNGYSGQLSCSDDIQKEIIISAVQDRILSILNAPPENILECRVSFSDYMFLNKYEGNIDNFIEYMCDEESKKEVYGSCVYYGADIDYGNLNKKDNKFLSLMTKCVLVKMKDNGKFPVNIIAGMNANSSTRMLNKYAMNVVDIHEYGLNKQNVYKGSVSENEQMKYCKPFAYYDETTFFSMKISNIDVWRKSIKEHSGFEGVKLESFELLTDLYVAKDGYVYFIPFSNMGIKPEDKGYTYFLLVNSDSNYRSYIVDNSDVSKTSFINDHIYVGTLNADDEWCIVRVKK